MDNRKELEEYGWKVVEKLLLSGFRATIDDESFREYSVKIEAEGHGIINLYYSPKKKNFKITFHEIENKEIRKEFEKILEMDAAETKGPATYTNKGYEIDVDGSYFNETTSYAAIIRKDGLVIKELKGLVNTDKVKSSNQITGEMKAVIKAIDYCNQNGIKEIRLYYDYNGLKYWALGKWKTNMVSTKYYKEFMQKQNIKIEWVKISSHTGVYWNEKVDKLAKSVILDKQGKG